MKKKQNSLFRKYPFLAVLGSIVLLIIVGYLVLLLSVLRPVNMMMGRSSSYDKSWDHVVSNIHLIKVGTSIDSVETLLGEPDSKYTNLNDGVVLSYQEYSVLAAHHVYDIHITNDTVSKIESYEW